jgi:hypothetical protein
VLHPSFTYQKERKQQAQQNTETKKRKEIKLDNQFLGEQLQRKRSATAEVKDFKVLSPYKSKLFS